MLWCWVSKCTQSFVRGQKNRLGPYILMGRWNEMKQGLTVFVTFFPSFPHWRKMLQLFSPPNAERQVEMLCWASSPSGSSNRKHSNPYSPTAFQFFVHSKMRKAIAIPRLNSVPEHRVAQKDFSPTPGQIINFIRPDSGTKPLGIFLDWPCFRARF